MVFAVTRSLDEYEEVRRRSDAVTVWGPGCHPGVAAAQRSFNEGRFATLVNHAPFVGEVGLDGSSRVPIERQCEVFDSILRIVAATPRPISIHSFRATSPVLDLIQAAGVKGAILHWWLGSEAETRRALDLGCLFSVNQSMNPSKLMAFGVPITSFLPETDHPHGNRHGTAPNQPGQTLEVERAVAHTFGVTSAQVRHQFWSTLAAQLDAENVVLLPQAVRAMVRHAKER